MQGNNRYLHTCRDWPSCPLANLYPNLFQSDAAPIIIKRATFVWKKLFFNFFDFFDFFDFFEKIFPDAAGGLRTRRSEKFYRLASKPLLTILTLTRARDYNTNHHYRQGANPLFNLTLNLAIYKPYPNHTNKVCFTISSNRYFS